MDDKHLRLAYAGLFCLALIAALLLWSQVGGQGHLDLMPWWMKLGLSLAASVAAVQAAAAAASDTPWGGRCLRWLGILLAVAMCCGLASYYYHLVEPQDTDVQEEQQVG